jgi:hypothetical protein
VYSSWPDAFAKLASEVGLPTTDVYEAREAVQAFIDRLRNAGAPPR